VILKWSNDDEVAWPASGVFCEGFSEPSEGLRSGFWLFIGHKFRTGCAWVRKSVEDIPGLRRGLPRVFQKLRAIVCFDAGLSARVSLADLKGDRKAPLPSVANCSEYSHTRARTTRLKHINFGSSTPRHCLERGSLARDLASIQTEI
jgi:hypothetical protein